MSSNVSLNDLPVEIIQHIGFFIGDNKDLSKVSIMNKNLNSCLQYELNQRAADKLLSHVVKGKAQQALAMIKANPALLLITGDAKDYSDGRRINQKPFEAALCAGDTTMAQKILPYFDKIEGIEPGEALRQFNNAYPKGVEETDKILQNNAYDFSSLINAIVNGNHVVINKEMLAFREVLSKNQVITQGPHFNMYHLIKAHSAYLDNFDKLTSWKNRDFFWQKVIGFIQRQMPAYYARTYCPPSGFKFFLPALGRNHAFLLATGGGNKSYGDVMFSITWYSMSRWTPNKWGRGFERLKSDALEKTKELGAIKIELATSNPTNLHDEMTGIRL